MKPKPITLSLAALLLLAPAAVAQDNSPFGEGVGLGATADTHVYAYEYKKWNASNWGSYDVLSAGWNPTGGEKRAYLKFDVSVLDPAKVAKARLRLYHYVTAGAPTLELGVHEVTAPWVEGVGAYPPKDEVLARAGELTWLAQPAYNTEPAARFKPGAEANAFVEVDVTAMVKGWLGGRPNHGLAIAPLGELGPDVAQSSYGFFARERGDEDKRPVLIIDPVTATTPPDPDPPTPDPPTPDPGTDTPPDVAGGDAELLRKRAYQEYIAAYNEMTKLMAAGKGDTPEGQAAYAKYAEVKKKYEALAAKLPPTGVDPGDENVPGAGGTTPASPAPKDIDEAYQQYLAAYNKLNKLMQSGDSDSPATQAAYKRYAETKKIYEDFKKKAPPTRSPDPVPGTDPAPAPTPSGPAPTAEEVKRLYSEYIAAYNQLTALMSSGRGNTPEAQKAYEAYEKLKREYEEALKKAGPQEPGGDVGDDVPGGGATTPTTDTPKAEAYKRLMAAAAEATRLRQTLGPDDPKTKAAEEAHQKAEEAYEALVARGSIAAGAVVSGGTDPVTPGEPTAWKAQLAEAYKEYIATYEAMTELAAAGDAGTPAGQEATKAYNAAKKAYEELLEKRPKP